MQSFSLNRLVEFMVSSDATMPDVGGYYSRSEVTIPNRRDACVAARAVIIKVSEGYDE